MKKLKLAVVFTVIACITGYFPKVAKSQSNLGIYCYSCAYNPMYPHLDKPSSTENNSQTSSRSSLESIRAQQRKCAREVYDRYNEPDRNDPSYPNFLLDLQNECVTRFLRK
jgi:hypothetical protein